jgi:hypothetical protein
MRVRLGDIPDPGELVPGSPGVIHALADDLSRRAALFEERGQALADIDRGGWTGTAGETYSDFLGRLPQHWFDAADGHREAARALDRYADTLEWAQQQAGECVRLLAAAEEASAAAAAAQAPTGVGILGLIGAPESPTVGDPGEAARREAEELLDRCRAQLSAAANEAASQVRRATENAPVKPLLPTGSGFGHPETAATPAHGSAQRHGGSQPAPAQALPSIIDQPVPYHRMMTGVVADVATAERSPAPFRVAVANWEQWVLDEPGRATGTLP